VKIEPQINTKDASVATPEQLLAELDRGVDWFAGLMKEELHERFDPDTPTPNDTHRLAWIGADICYTEAFKRWNEHLKSRCAHIRYGHSSVPAAILCLCIMMGTEPQGRDAKKGWIYVEDETLPN